MTIAGLWRYGDMRHVATGCTALVHFKFRINTFWLFLYLNKFWVKVNNCAIYN